MRGYRWNADTYMYTNVRTEDDVALFDRERARIALTRIIVDDQVLID